MNMAPLELPLFEKIPDGLRNGRNVREGYARGWGLQFGDLTGKIAADPLYQEAVALARGRTIQSEPNRMNIYLLLRFFLGGLPHGHIVEFGSYRGGSAIFMAKVCQHLHPEVHIHGFDTFTGMPETDRTVDAHNEGDFAGVDLEELRAYVASIGLTNLHFVGGRFEDTAPRALTEIGQVRLCHIDCDIRSAVAYSYDVSRPYMVSGGYLVLDDALFSSCIGATEAVEELIIRRDALNSEQIYPQFVFRAP